MDVPPVSSSELQFDKAEFATSDAATPRCFACQAPIAGEYYDVNGHTSCPSCKAQVEHTLGRKPGAAGFMQCLSFCLFDVYGVSAEKKIEVQRQSNCKTDCPACSRVCPEVAILFPKYKAGPINGDEVNAADLEREKMKVDISALLGGDIYAALRQRSVDAKERFTRERDEKRALEERKKCLAKLQQALDIPPEVLAALPSQDQISAKLEQALNRAGQDS